MSDSIRFGLYVGDEAITSTAPVFGLSATAAPHLPAQQRLGQPLRPGLDVEDEVVAVIVVPFSLSPSLSMIVPRFASDAVR